MRSPGSRHRERFGRQHHHRADRLRATVSHCSCRRAPRALLRAPLRRLPSGPRLVTVPFSTGRHGLDGFRKAVRSESPFLWSPRVGELRYQRVTAIVTWSVVRTPPTSSCIGNAEPGVTLGTTTFS